MGSVWNDKYQVKYTLIATKWTHLDPMVSTKIEGQVLEKSLNISSDSRCLLSHDYHAILFSGYVLHHLVNDETYCETTESLH